MATFLYRDGANYKFEFTAKCPEGLTIGDETTIEELGYTKESFFGSEGIRGYEYDEEIDHNIVELVELEIGDLPDNFWEIIEKHLPKYYSSDEVLFNDRLTCYLDDEIFDEEELKRFQETYKTKADALKELQESSVYLYTEAMSAKAETDKTTAL